MPLSAAVRRQINLLSQEQPEAGPWLSVLEATLAEAGGAVWNAASVGTMLSVDQAPCRPLLAGARIPADHRSVDRWVRSLLALAGATGPHAASLRGVTNDGGLNTVAFLETALNADGDAVAVMAGEFRMEPAALGAVAHLAAIPLLQALRRRFSAAANPRWRLGACPMCGSWPTVAEQRGLERSRRLRCGRCGEEWEQPGSLCPFCDTAGHGTRAALAAEAEREFRRAETCGACGGYLKSVSTLRAWTGDEVVLADLATIDLDIVAVERGFARPEARPLAPPARLMGAHA